MLMQPSQLRLLTLSEPYSACSCVVVSLPVEPKLLLGWLKSTPKMNVKTFVDLVLAERGGGLEGHQGIVPTYGVPIWFKISV